LKDRPKRQSETEPEVAECASWQDGDASCTSNTLLESMIEQSPIAVWISDATGTVLRTNSSWRRTMSVCTVWRSRSRNGHKPRSHGWPDFPTRNPNVESYVLGVNSYIVKPVDLISSMRQCGSWGSTGCC
jgi:hypothetical protein